MRVLGTNGGVGHLAVQLAGETLVGPDQPCDLVFDTAGGDALAAAIGSAPRIVSVAEEADHVTYFIVESNRTQLIELGRRADAGELNASIDSTFALEDAAAAFARVGERQQERQGRSRHCGVTRPTDRVPSQASRQTFRRASVARR